MKVTDRDPHFFDDWRTEADDDVTLAGFIGAAAAFAMFLIVVLVYVVIAWSAA